VDINQFIKHSDYEWQIPATGKMRVPVIIYASEELIRGMDDKVAVQALNVASLPGILKASYAMPDTHWGYGFPIGGVAAFDPDEGGVVSAGGVGFDISCGVRTLVTGLQRHHIETHCCPVNFWKDTVFLIMISKLRIFLQRWTSLSKHAITTSPFKKGD